MSVSNSNSSEKEDNLQEKSIPVKIEDKPFDEFINNHLIPEFRTQLEVNGVPLKLIILKKDQRPVVGGECWVLHGEFLNGKRFWLTFNSNNIKAQKNISLAESASEPSLLESFLIDEKKITLQLITSRFLQRLNGQKWLGNN